MPNSHSLYEYRYLNISVSCAWYKARVIPPDCVYVLSVSALLAVRVQRRSPRKGPHTVYDGAIHHYGT